MKTILYWFILYSELLTSPRYNFGIFLSLPTPHPPKPNQTTTATTELYPSVVAAHSFSPWSQQVLITFRLHDCAHSAIPYHWHHTACGLACLVSSVCHHVFGTVALELHFFWEWRGTPDFLPRSVVPYTCLPTCFPRPVRVTLPNRDTQTCLMFLSSIPSTSPTLEPSFPEQC